MTSVVPRAIRLLKAAAPVGALVADRIEPEQARQGAALPLVVVRGASERPVYGLAPSTGLREARFTVLCAAATYTAADRPAETVNAARRDVRHAGVAGQRVTLVQDGEDTGAWDAQGRTFPRIVGFRGGVTT